MQKKDFQLLCQGLGRINDGEGHLAIQPTDVSEPNDLVYLRNRYYSPELGQFISQDPLEGSNNDPMSLNRYAYVNNNPVNFTDPSGLIGCMPALDVAFSQVPTPTSTPPCDLVSKFVTDFGVSEETAKAYMADLLTSVAYAQNGALGYENVILTMAATLNSVDYAIARGGSIVGQLEQSQSALFYTRSYCGDPLLQQKIEIYDCCVKQEFKGNTGLSHCQNVTKDQCNTVTLADLRKMFDCADRYNNALAGDRANNAARDLVDGRCGSTPDSAAKFTGTLADKIRAIDGDPDMRYVYSFDASWNDDFEDWKQCRQNQDPTFNAELLSAPGNSRAAMITNKFNIPCESWQDAKDSINNPAPDYTRSCCGGGPGSTPTPGPTRIP